MDLQTYRQIYPLYVSNCIPLFKLNVCVSVCAIQKICFLLHLKLKLTWGLTCVCICI